MSASLLNKTYRTYSYPISGRNCKEKNIIQDAYPDQNTGDQMDIISIDQPVLWSWTYDENSLFTDVDFSFGKIPEISPQNLEGILVNHLIPNDFIEDCNSGGATDPDKLGDKSHIPEEIKSEIGKNTLLLQRIRLSSLDGTRGHAAVMSESISGKVKSLKSNALFITSKEPEVGTIFGATSSPRIFYKKQKSFEKRHKCGTCDASFSQRGNLKVHIRVHTGEKPYKCSLCVASFSQSVALKAHMRTHTGEKPYHCTFCEASFTQTNGLNSHMRIHTGEKPFKCTLCVSSFSQYCSLICHMRMHTGEKPYRCTLCDASFTQSSNLKAHLRTHMRKKSHKCTQCKLLFKDTSHLKRHVRTHQREKPYKCSSCEISFSRLYQLKFHTKRHTRSHKKYHTSDYCGSEASEDCTQEIHCGSSSPHEMKVADASCGAFDILRHAHSFTTMPEVQGKVKDEVTDSLANEAESSLDFAMPQVKEEIEMEEYDIDEVTV